MTGDDRMTDTRNSFARHTCQQSTEMVLLAPRPSPSHRSTPTADLRLGTVVCLLLLGQVLGGCVGGQFFLSSSPTSCNLCGAGTYCASLTGCLGECVACLEGTGANRPMEAALGGASLCTSPGDGVVCPPGAVRQVGKDGCYVCANGLEEGSEDRCARCARGFADYGNDANGLICMPNCDRFNMEILDRNTRSCVQYLEECQNNSDCGDGQYCWVSVAFDRSAIVVRPGAVTGRNLREKDVNLRAGENTSRRLFGGTNDGHHATILPNGLHANPRTSWGFCIPGTEFD